MHRPKDMNRGATDYEVACRRAISLPILFECNYKSFAEIYAIRCLTTLSRHHFTYQATSPSNKLDLKFTCLFAHRRTVGQNGKKAVRIQLTHHLLINGAI